MNNKFCIWEKLMPYIKRISTEDMYTDMKFYIRHDREMYFTGMVGIAASYVFFSGLFVIFALYLIISASDPLALATSLNCLGFAFIASIGFIMVKNYLHLRKDYIELKEMLQK